MPDYGSKVADKAIDQTTRKVHRIYSQAVKELKAKLKEFNAAHKEKQKEMAARLKNGEITKAAYESWMRGQVFIGKQWQDKVDQAVRIVQDATTQAAGIVHKDRLNVFAENYNFAAYQLEKRAKGVVSFNIYNENTVAKLIKDKPKMLPSWKINETKDYKWSRQKVENSVTQGIIQGESIDKITDRLAESLCSTNESRMRTFARTSITGAQNAGRQAQMEDAEDEGIKVKKRWVATLDSRTRDTHQELDGQEVPIDEPFEVDGMEIMYPGDPNAEPELVYNCRCTMIEVYEGIDRKSVRRAYDDDENGERDTANSYTVENMTYKEWKEWKENGKQPITKESKAEKTEPAKPKTLVVNDAKQIERDRKENEDRDRRMKELDDEYRKSWEAESQSRREMMDARSQLLDGKITQEEYDKRRADIVDRRDESRRRSAEIDRERRELQEESVFTFNSASLVDTAQADGIEYMPPAIREKKLDTDEIVAMLGGGDLTDGSCASLAFCYVGQQDGLDVLDFRDGASRSMMSKHTWGMMSSISKETGKPLLKEATKTGAGGAIKLARQMEEGKEYYFVTARHAAIMRQRGGVIEYMELQSATKNGWSVLGKAEDRKGLESMFRWRFGSASHISGRAVMMDVEDMKGSKILQRAYGYMNTAAGKQRKGLSGTIK